MIQKNPFLKYMMKDKKKDVFHSSAYAKAQSGETIGAASTESYQVRVNVNQNRQMVRGYRDSQIMTDASKNASRAKTWNPSEQGKAVDTAVTGQSPDDAAVSNRGNTNGAVISNRDKVDNAVVSNRGKVGNAVVSNRNNLVSRAPQVPTRRMGISIK